MHCIRNCISYAKGVEIKKTEMLSNSNKNIDIKLCDISKTTKMKLEKCTKTRVVNCGKKRKQSDIGK